MSKKQRLELTWIGKDQQPKLEPRILIEDPEKSYGDQNTENMLIFGDNLLALKALEQEYAGKVKCIFIDPPYNTGNAFGDYYEDGLEHSTWLNLISERVVSLYNLLTPDGSMWVTLDDNEVHYFKVMADEIFGRANFVASIVWEKDAGRKNDTDISTSHDYILIYAKNRSIWRKSRNLLEREEAQLSRYKNPDNDPRGPWRQGADGTAKSGSESLRYEITLPSGRIVTPPSGNFWRFSKNTFETALQENRVYFGRNGDSLPIIKKYLSEIQGGIVPKTWWPSSEVGSNQEARRDHLRKLLPDIEPFPTPKPERLLKRILEISTNPGDLVLDSFAGSGTTGAVAHKMGRRWIMVELKEHCHTHIIPRLKKVINGEDLGGISTTTKVEPEIKLCKSCKEDLCEKCAETIGESQKGGEQVWFGGGGFKYYFLAPSLLKQDRFSNWVIDESYNPEMLAAAMAKHEGFRYQPDETVYWKQGRSTEKDFIFTTTNFVTVEFLDKIHEEMQPDESLLICCKSFRKECEERYPNITVKKIPKVLLGRCEFGRDDYSLNVINIPTENDDNFLEEPEAIVPVSPPSKGRKTSKKPDAQKQLSLMGE